MFECKNCGKSLSNKFSKKRHEERCGGTETVESITCSECNKSFRWRHKFLEHWRQHHDKESLSRPKIECDDCGKTFCEKREFLNHWTKYHNLPNARMINSRKVPLKCALCHIDVSALAIIHHYINRHEISGLGSYEYLEFNDENSFKEWKKSIEKSTTCQYINDYGQSTQKTMKFICHRSGEFKSVSKGICNLKTQGSKKIGGFCPASIHKETVEENKIIVRFLKTHVGHENELCHINISPSKKKDIAEKLAQKIPKRNILNDIRDSYTEDNMNSPVFYDVNQRINASRL